MRIFDCFTFFNELDLLEFRLKLLDQYVDFFVIAESNLTHSGEPKAYIFEDNKHRYSQWQAKIIYLPVKQSKDGLTFNENEEKYNIENGSWYLENEQRNALHLAAKYMDEKDMVITGDLDEIPNPAVLKKLKAPDVPFALSMIFHNYYMNCRISKGEKLWNGSIVSNGKTFFENTPQQLRNNRNSYKQIKKGGWHFSYLGGVEKIKDKLQAFAHTEFNKPEYFDEAHILASLENGQDVLKRENTEYKLSSLRAYPSQVRKLMKHYPHFIKQNPSKKNWLNFLKR